MLLSCTLLLLFLRRGGIASAQIEGGGASDRCEASQGFLEGFHLAFELLIFLLTIVLFVSIVAICRHISSTSMAMMNWVLFAALSSLLPLAEHHLRVAFLLFGVLRRAAYYLTAQLLLLLHRDRKSVV